MKTEYKHYAAVKHLDNLETLKATFYSHSFGRHYHEGYAIGVILKGSETYQCNKITHVAPKGSIVVVNPGEIHTGHASDTRKGWEYFMIYPHLSLIQKALRQLSLDPDQLPFFPVSVMFDPALKTGLCRFMAACESGDCKLSLETRFLSLLRLLIDHHADFNMPAAPERPAHTVIRRVTERIHACYDEDLSLDSLAAEAGISPYSLLRLFKKQTGISPYLLQTGLKIKNAKKNLASGHSFAQTAVNCGFTDQSHMTRQFKRWLGITPGEYFKASQENRIHTPKTRGHGISRLPRTCPKSRR